VSKILIAKCEGVEPVKLCADLTSVKFNNNNQSKTMEGQPNNNNPSNETNDPHPLESAHPSSLDMESLLRQWGGSNTLEETNIDESTSITTAPLPSNETEIIPPFLGRSHSTTPHDSEDREMQHRRIASTGTTHPNNRISSAVVDHEETSGDELHSG
jgi:hypothetical protein